MWVCHREEDANRLAVDDFHDTYGQRGTLFPCAYDPRNIEQGAVLEKAPVTFLIFHVLFWPFICIFAGAIICVVFCRRCRQDEFAKDHNADALGGGGMATHTPPHSGVRILGLKIVHSDTIDVETTAPSKADPRAAESKAKISPQDKRTPIMARLLSRNNKKQSPVDKAKESKHKPKHSPSTDSIGLKLAGKPSVTLGEEALQELANSRNRYRTKPLQRADGKGKHTALQSTGKDVFL